MKGFQEITFDVARCRVELAAFGDLLASKRELSEERDILPFFREHPRLSALVASYQPALGRRERLISYGYSLFGDFGADLVIGSRTRASFCFVEFENATPTSIFTRSSRELPSWSTRFTAGFSKIVDWFWKLSEFQHTPDFARTFGRHSADCSGVLVIGRSADRAPREAEPCAGSGRRSW